MPQGNYLTGGDTANGLAAAGTTSGGGGIDPVSAIAGALGDLFNAFTQVGRTRQAQIETQGALLLASQPKARKQHQDYSALIALAVVVAVLIIVLFAFKKQ